MQVQPLQNRAQGSLGKIAVNNTQLNINRYLVFSVHCMEMGWLMFPVEHRDYDA